MGFLTIFFAWLFISILIGIIVGDDNIGFAMFLSFISVIGLIAYGLSDNKNKEAKKTEAINSVKMKLMEAGFQISFYEESTDRTSVIALDAANRRIALFKIDANDGRIEERFLNIKDILDMEVVEDGRRLMQMNSELSGTLASAAIGGLVFGGAGAVVGALANQSNANVTQVGLVFQLDDIATPHITFNFLGSSIVKKGSTLHLRAVDQARFWYARNKAMVQRVRNQNVNDVPQQIAFTAILTSLGGNPLKVLQELVPVTGMEYPQVMALFVNVPQFIKQGITISEAEMIKQRIETHGGKVDLTEIAL